MPGRGGRNRRKDPFRYWNNVAPTKPEAQALAARLGLEFPTSYFGFKAGLLYPVRRLIVTGEDTPANLEILLGPLWENEDRSLIKKTRIDVLLCPPPGSPSYDATIYLDEGSPHWNPRAANADEQAEIAKVREMQEIVEQQMEGQEGFDSSKFRQVLMGMGENWVDNLPILERAVNSTIQNASM
ncbi:hypothetical protein MMC07_003826 [Pseudocyphellaria aurata]|nr:hypothetical protein [Pseudocyphellaria aurata]